MQRKSDNGGRFRARNLTFDRAGIDKRVCHADSIERVTMVVTPSPPLSNFICIILAPLRYASGKAERFSFIPLFLRISASSVESVGKKHLSVCLVCLISSEGLIVYSSLNLCHKCGFSSRIALKSHKMSAFFALLICIFIRVVFLVSSANRLIFSFPTADFCG